MKSKLENNVQITAMLQDESWHSARQQMAYGCVQILISLAFDMAGGPPTPNPQLFTAVKSLIILLQNI